MGAGVGPLLNAGVAATAGVGAEAGVGALYSTNQYPFLSHKSTNLPKESTQQSTRCFEARSTRRWFPTQYLFYQA